MQANQNPQNRQQRITQATSCSFKNKYGTRLVHVDKQIGCTHDVKHFLVHNVTFENLKPLFSQLTWQQMTGVFLKSPLWPEFLERIVFCDKNRVFV